MKYLFFDTETTGLPLNYKAPIKDVNNWPRLVQLAWILTDASGNTLETYSTLVKPDGWLISKESTAVHGITQERAAEEGVAVADVLRRFARLVYGRGITLVAHNIDFDYKIVGAELYRLGWPLSLSNVPMICTMHASTEYCKLPSKSKYGGYKWPKLQELHQKLFGEGFMEAHNAEADIKATVRCFYKLVSINVIILEERVCKE